MKKIMIVFLCLIGVLTVNTTIVDAAEEVYEQKISKNVKDFVKVNNLSKDDYLTVGVILSESNIFIKPNVDTYIEQAELNGDFKLELHNYREALKDYNQNYISCFIGKSDYDVIYSSNYSSIIVINITVKDLEKLSKHDEVQSIRFLTHDYRLFDVSSELLDCPELSEFACTVFNPSQSYNVATNVIGTQGSLNDGDGVTVGILEEGKPDLSNIEFQQKTFGTVTIDQSPFGVDNHATDSGIVIAGGLNGIVPHANIVHEQFEMEVTIENFLQNVENLIEADVNVINMSAGLLPNIASHGEYDEVSFLLDILLLEVSVTFVKSAGNNGNRAYTMQNESDLITSPGSASNIIVVGSTDNNGNYLSTFSSTQTYSGSLDDGTSTQLSNKPDLLAPGGQEYRYYSSPVVTQIAIYRVEVPNSETDSFKMFGTSLAAPQVTGIIAMMMDQREILMFRPALVKTILVAGASQDVLVKSQLSDSGLQTTSCNFDSTNGYSDMCGFGLVDAEESLRLVQHQDYKSYSNNDHVIPTSGKLNIYDIEVNLIAGETVIISNAYMRNHGSSNGGYNTYFDMSDIDIQVTGYGLNIESNASNFNSERISFVVPTTGKYLITVWLDEVNGATGITGAFLDNIGFIVVNAGRDVEFVTIPLPPPCKPGDMCDVTY